MLKILNHHYNGFKKTLHDNFDKLVTNHFGNAKQKKQGTADEEIITIPHHMKTQHGYGVYTNNGKLGQHICEGWAFLDATLKQAWRFGLIGQPEYYQQTTSGRKVLSPICPFCLLKHMLVKLKRYNLNSWVPMLSLMDLASGFDIPKSSFRITNVFVNSSFIIGENRVLGTVEYLKEKTKKNLWKISTWRFGMKCSEILKHNTEADKARLPPMTRCNKPHAQKRAFATANTHTAKESRIEEARNLMGL